MIEAPIDSLGSMPGGQRTFNGVEGLKTELLKDRDLLVRSLAKSMYSSQSELTREQDAPATVLMAVASSVRSMSAR